MASYQKMYLHDPTTTVGGTKPGAGTQSTADSTPTFSGSTASTNRSMDASAGTTQVSISTGAQAFGTVATNCFMARFVSEPLNAQTIAAGNWTLSGAANESSANANMNYMGGVLYVWRPSTGARIGYIFDLPNNGITEPGTGQTAIATVLAGSAITAQAGDVLIIEVWCDGTPSMSGTYQTLFMYDGTTEASATDVASFLNAPAAISFQDAAVTYQKTGIGISPNVASGTDAVIFSETGVGVSPNTGGGTSQKTASGISKTGIGVIGSAVGSYPTEVLADSPALYWRLGESSGTNANDETANNRDGTYGAGVTLGQTSALAGDTNTAVDLNNSTTGVINSSYNPFANGVGRTFEGWAWRDTAVATDALFSGSADGYVRLDASGNVDFDPNTSSGGAQQTWTAAWPGTGQWVHWVLIFNESTDTAELFINSISQGTKTVTDPWPASPGNFQVGVRSTNSDPFDGKMDEIAVYESILSGARITAHYNAGTMSPNGFVGSGAKAMTFAETGNGISPLTVLGADVFNPVETGSGISPRVASGTDVFTAAETGTGISPHVGSGVSQKQAAAVVKTGIGIINNFIGSGVDSFTSTETGTSISPRVASAADVLTASETGSGVSAFNSSGSKSTIFSDSGAGITTFTVLGARVHEMNKTGLGIMPHVGFGSDAFTATESGIGVAVFSASGTKVLAGAPIIYTKSGLAIAAFVASGVDVATFSETGAGISARTASGIDSSIFSETGTAISPLIGSGFKSRERLRSGLGASTFIAFGDDVFVATKTGTGIMVMSASGFTPSAALPPTLIFPLDVELQPSITLLDLVEPASTVDVPVNINDVLVADNDSTVVDYIVQTYNVVYEGKIYSVTVAEPLTDAEIEMIDEWH